MTGFLYRLGGRCADHRWVVAGLWVVVCVAVAIWGSVLGSKSSDDLSLPGTDSQAATNLLAQKFPKQQNGASPLVMVSDKEKLTDGENSDAIKKAVKQLKNDGHVAQVNSPLEQGSGSMSEDEKTAYINVFLKQSTGQLTVDQAKHIIDKGAGPLKDVDLMTSTGGLLGQKVSQPKTESSEAVGLAAAILILLLTFGSVVAMGMPIGTAVIGLVTSISLISVLSHVYDVPTIGPTLATMIGLGVGIDYALFLVTRHRTLLAGGLDVRESIARTTATSGAAVAFAGTTVIIAICSLGAAGLPLITNMGLTASIAVLVAVVAAVTLLPALMAIAGTKINALAVFRHRPPTDEELLKGSWAYWARKVVRHPWFALIAGLVIIIPLSIPTFSLYLGQQDVADDPKSTTTRQAYDAIRAGFSVGVNGPLLVVEKLDGVAKPTDAAEQQQQEQQEEIQQQQQQAAAAGEPPPPAPPPADIRTSDPRIAGLEKDLKKESGVESVSPAQLDSKGDAALITVIPTTPPAGRRTADLVTNVRADVIPEAIGDKNAVAHVGGSTANNVDLATKIGDKLPVQILIVIGLSFIVLLMAFRSVLVPLKAAVMNLLSVAAAYGVLTLVFQDGWGASLIGLEGSVPIASFVPLMMFAVLFGLSMDYEVFLMTQIKESYSRDRDYMKSVIVGLASSGRVITSAALIMVAVFASFVLNGDPTVKQFGVGLALAVAIDSTLVRCLLVPGVMVLLKDSAWWMPKWLDRIIPRIHIEGGDYFDKK